MATDLQPSNLLTTDDPFTDDSLTRFTHWAEGDTSPSSPAPMFSIGGGVATLVESSLIGDTGDIIVEGAPLSVPQTAVSVTVASMSYTGAPGWSRSGPAVARNGGNSGFVAGFYDQIGRYLNIQIVVGGIAYFGTQVNVTLTAPYSLMLTIVSNSAVLWYRTSGGAWTKASVYDLATHLDLRTQDLSSWYGGIAAFSNIAAGSSTWTYDDLKIGSFGHLGIRDLAAVSHEDGTPVLTGNVATLMATCTDSEGAAYCGVFTFDLVTRVLIQTGVIFVSRDGMIYNDNAGQIVEASSGGYHFLITTWGNFGAANIQILYKHETVLNLLAGINVVGGMTQLSLAGIPLNGGGYDPYLVKVGPTWYLAYTAGPPTPSSYYPVLNSSADLSSWTLVGSDTSAVPYEGTIILYLASSHWVVCSTIVATGYSPDVNVYDLSMVYQGKFQALSLTSGFAPHAMLIPCGDYIYCVTFDNNHDGWNYSTFGNLRVLRTRRYGVSP